MFKNPNVHFDPIHFGGNDENCRIPAVAGRAAVFLMGDTILGGLLGAIMSPWLGDLSDRYGRKPIMIFTSFGGLIKEIISIVAATYPETFPVGWFYVGFVADGICGTFIAGLAIAHCYATDCTPPNKRNVAFGFYQGMLFAGIGLGPVLIGLIIKATESLKVAFYVAFVCHLVFICNLLFVVPESLSKRRQEAAQEKRRLEQMTKSSYDRKLLVQAVRLFTRLFQPLKILWPTGEGSSALVRRNLVLLCAIDTTMFGVAMGAVTVVLLYTNQKFGWGNLEQSEMVSIINICRVACLFILLPIITRLLRGPASKRVDSQQNGCDWVDLVIIRIAVFFDTLGFLGYTLSQSGTLFILSGCVSALGGIGSPTLQSSLTKHVPASRTGQLLGASAMMHALARLIAPVIFSTIFYATVGTYIQTVFLSLTVTFGIAWVCTWFLRSGVFVDTVLEPDSSVNEPTNDGGQIGRF